MTLATGLAISPLSPIIGAEIHGLDLSRPLSERAIADVRSALNTHHVIFFRDQELSPSQQADFARQFGVVTEGHPVIPTIERQPEVLVIDSREDRASWWHTDVTFLQAPPSDRSSTCSPPRRSGAIRHGRACRTPMTDWQSRSALSATP